MNLKSVNAYEVFKTKVHQVHFFRPTEIEIHSRIIGNNLCENVTKQIQGFKCKEHILLVFYIVKEMPYEINFTTKKSE